MANAQCRTDFYLRPPQWNNNLLSDVQCHVRSAGDEVSESGWRAAEDNIITS
jgi:hypothetical protein